MKSLKKTLAMLAPAIVLGAAIPAWCSVPTMQVAQPAAQKLLGQATRDVDSMELIFANNPDPSKQAFYRKEYSQGVRAYSNGRYEEAAEHLRTADQAVRSIAEYNHLE